MIKNLYLVWPLISLLNLNTQAQSTTTYAGTYKYGSGNEADAGGVVKVYPESDSTILFYIDICIGEPSYNSGSLYGRVTINRGQGVFSTKNDYSNIGCKWLFDFVNDTLKLSTTDHQYECGFGNGVVVDGCFSRISNIIPEFFENGGSRKVYFKDTKPEDYYK